MQLDCMINLDGADKNLKLLEMAEITGWMLLGLAALTYTRSNAVSNKAPVLKGPSPDREIDVTRWRHDGEQPVYHKSGNQASFIDEQVRKLTLALPTHLSFSNC